MRRTRGLVACAFLLSIFTLKSQSINSPYTNFGIGELSDYSMQHNTAMGGFGIGAAENLHINSQNPAWAVKNQLTIFEVGVQADIRNYLSGNQTFNNRTGSLRYMGISVPLILNRWSSNVTLLPLSSVNYRIRSESIIEETGEVAQNVLDGSGGLSRITWSHGVRILKKTYLGARASYVFGAINSSEQTTVLDENGLISTNTYTITYNDESSYSDFIYGVSLASEFSISENRSVNVGITYDLERNLEGSRNRVLERITTVGGNFNSLELEEDAPVTYALPSALGVGIAYERNNALTLGVDALIRDWSNDSENSSERYRTTRNITAGGRWVPDYRSVDSYFSRVGYRFGLSYREVPYLVNDTRINEFGINFGISLPVSGASNVDLGFKLGRRGTSSNGLVREDFLQVVFGMTINDRWFIKRRYD